MGEAYRYNQEDNGWTTNGEIRHVGNGYDLEIETDIPGFLYETHCFDVLAKGLPDANWMLLGSHVVDQVHSENGDREFIRHDGLALKLNPDPNVSEATVAFVIEMKCMDTISSHEIQRKTEGIGKLMDRCRKHPGHLAEGIQDVLGDTVSVPETIHIPENDQLPVLFCALFEKEVKSPEDTCMPVIFRKISRGE